MEIPFFIFEYEDGSVVDIMEERYEMAMDTSCNVASIEVYTHKRGVDSDKLKVGDRFKLLSYDFCVDEVVITSVENFDEDLADKFGMIKPLFLINIKFESDMESGSDYDKFKKLYDRNYKIKKITERNGTS